MIYEINGIQIMLDSDLARLYQCKNGTKGINQAVRNNTLKFPERFSCVFTEQCVMMLATILKSEVAVKISISIIDAFVKLRRYVSNSLMNSEMLINYEFL